MPIILRVHTYQNAPPAVPLAHRFDRLGGSLGRSPANDLALDDPGKYISRSHARIEFRDGGYALVDIGSNPSVVNDRPVGIGHAVMLADGDRIALGDYLLAVSVEPEAVPASSSPASSSNPLRPDPPSPAPAAHPALNVDPEDSLASAGILDVGNAPLGAGFDPLGLNLFGSPEPASAAPAVPAWRGAESDHVPPEQMSFAAPQPTAFAPPPGFAPPAQPRMPPAHVPPPAAAGGMRIPDAPPVPFASMPAPMPAAAPPPAPAPMPAVMPTAMPAGMPMRATPAMSPSPAAAPSAVLEPSEATMLAPASASEASTSAAPMDAPSFAPHDPAPPATPPISAGAHTPAPAHMPARAAGASAEADPVIQALMRGLGLSELNTRRTPEEIAELAGAMLREATSGTMGVLLARAMTKRESRLDMTMIGAQANNPLKFFPDAHSALTQMVNGTMPGYMAPVRAFAGAFDDLKAHELAIMAGMRAALSGVLERFDPAAIEARLQVPTVMDKVLASNRKAKMWDRMVELYAQMAGEADSDFQRLFGEAFGTAYEEQVERLRQSRP